MEPEIKNLDLFGEDFFDGLDLHLLSQAAKEYYRDYSLLFTIKKVHGTVVTIRVVQETTSTGNYFTSKELVNMTKSLFYGQGLVPTDWVIHVHPIEY